MTYTHEQDLPTRHILNGSRAPEQLLAGVGVNGKQLPAKRGSKRTGTLLLAVLALLLLRYVVEVKVTFSWRALPWHLTARHGVRHCSNTCFKAGDGICDEGRLALLSNNSTQQGQQGRRQPQQLQQTQQLPEGVTAVECDLGTDCDDCGPWFGPQADIGWTEPELPIAFLRSHNISVRSRLVNPRSAAPLLGMSFAYVDPALDLDVSRHMETSGVVEMGISQLFYTLLAERCGRGSSAGLVADVGANFGYFSLLAAKLGCSVIAWEPVPQFRALLSYNLAANKLTEHVQVRANVVAYPPGSKQVVHAPNRGIWGTAGIDGVNIDTGIANDGEYWKVETIADSLDDALGGQHVDLLKVDVEGFESSVMSTATQLLSAGAIENIIIEYTPGVLERAARWDEMWRPPQMLLNLTAAGFDLLWLSDEFTRVWTESRSMTAPLPELRRITKQNLAYDMWDARAHKTGWLDRDEVPFCQAMVELGMHNNGIPERLHPKSFHANFAHNTNIWATRNKQLLAKHPHVLGHPVGIFPLTTPTNASWFPPRGVDEGLGAVRCSELAADMKRKLEEEQPTETVVKAMMAVLIGRRCRCTHNLPCKHLEEAAEACAVAGQTPYRDQPEGGPGSIAETPTTASSQSLL